VEPTKRCRDCENVKPLAEFYRNHKAKDGRSHRCRDCEKIYQVAYAARNAERKAAYLRAYRQTPGAKAVRHRTYIKRAEKRMLYNAKKRATEQGLPFDLDLTDIVIPETCPVLGIPLVRGRGHSNKDDAPSLDKIVPGLGYVKGNVRVVSFRANSLKRDASFEEVELLYRDACRLREAKLY
jgi:hypothetical protein